METIISYIAEEFIKKIINLREDKYFFYFRMCSPTLFF